MSSLFAHSSATHLTGQARQTRVSAEHPPAQQASPESALVGAIDKSYIPARQLAGKVVGVWGDALVRTPDGIVQPLHVGGVLHPGDVVLTSQDGIVQLEAVPTRPALANNIDTVIEQLAQGNPNTVPGAGLVQTGAQTLLEGLRVDRVQELTLPAGPALVFASDPKTSLPVNETVPARAPADTALPDSVSAEQNGISVSFDPRANDSFDRSPVLLQTLAGQAINAGAPLQLPQGSFALNPDGGLTFTPAPEFSGSFVLPYTATDGTGSAAGATITITVTAVNAPPMAVNDSASVNEDTPVVLNLLGNDSDAEGDPLQITAINGQAATPGSTLALLSASGQALGELTLHADGTVTFVPAPNYNGPVNFTYTVSDGHGGGATAAAHIDVLPVNDPPVALNDQAITAEDTVVHLNLLANDSDPDGDRLTITQLNGQAVVAGSTITLTDSKGTPTGLLTLNADGTVSLVPALHFNGAVDFSYTVADGQGGTATANTHVEVTPVDNPSVLAPDTQTVAEDTPALGNVLANDSDVDNPLSVDSFTLAGITANAGQTTAIAGLGTLSIAANGDYVFTPDANWNGAVPSVSYTTNTGASSTLDITVTPVDDAPQGQDALRTTPEDMAYVIKAADVGYSDPDGDAMAGVRIDALPGHGLLTLNGLVVQAGQTISVADISSGLLVFTPASNASGSPYAGLSFSVQDSTGLTDTTPNVLTLNVTAVADAPVLDIIGKAYSASSDFEEVDLPGYGKILATDLHGGVWRTDNNGGTVEVGDASTYLATHSTNQVIELEQDPRDRSNLYTTVSVEAGEVYALSFDFAARQNSGSQTNSQIFVYWEGQLVQVLNSTSGILTNISMDLIATTTGTSKLEFIAGDANSYGGVLDNLSLALQQNTGYQGHAVHLPDITASLTDLDHSESLALRIAAIPIGATLTDGVHSFTATAGSSTADVSSWDLTQLNLVPPHDLAGQVSLQVIATSTEVSNGDSSMVTAQLDLNILPNSQGLMGSAGDDMVVGTPGDDRLWGLTGNDLINAGDGNDIVVGGQGSDTLRGEAGNDTLDGGVGNDVLVGGTGRDVLSGGPGNDTLTGGTGAGDDGATDTFRWALGDGGKGGAPAVDTITDFSAAAVNNNGDVLDLRDLLQGELKAVNNGAGTLQNYLDFDTTSSSGQTIIHVSTTGQFLGGAYSPAAEDQRIVLANLDLRAAMGLAGNASDNLVIQELLTRGKLITDGP